MPLMCGVLVGDLVLNDNNNNNNDNNDNDNNDSQSHKNVCT